MWLRGISPPASSFQDRWWRMFLTNSSVNGLNVNFLLKENFCFNLIMLGSDQNLLIIMPISSKMLHFGSSGHSNKSRFLVVDWNKLLNNNYIENTYNYQVKFYSSKTPDLFLYTYFTVPNFKNDLTNLLKNIKLRSIKSFFQRQLTEDIEMQKL